jgi:hypothetical protein
LKAGDTMTGQLIVPTVRGALKSPSGYAGYGTNDWTAAFQATPISSWAFMEDQSAGGPTGQWWFNVNMRHQNGGGYWGMQQAWGWEDNANEFYTRNFQNGVASSWVRFLNSNNFGTYALPIAGGTITGALTVNGNLNVGGASHLNDTYTARDATSGALFFGSSGAQYIYHAGGNWTFAGPAATAYFPSVQFFINANATSGASTFYFDGSGTKYLGYNGTDFTFDGGYVYAPTPPAADNSTKLATTAWVGANASGFPAGTVLPFYNAAAPTGWTKLTTQNDKALRVVSGSGGVAGGTNAFSTVMAQTVVGGHTLIASEMAAHQHNMTQYQQQANGGVAGGGLNPIMPNGQGAYPAPGTDTVGSNAAHNHTITMAIQYVDLILASKN